MCTLDVTIRLPLLHPPSLPNRNPGPGACPALVLAAGALLQPMLEELLQLARVRGTKTAALGTWAVWLMSRGASRDSRALLPCEGSTSPPEVSSEADV